ncbi:hypothetical protein, partial [Corallococcus sp. CA054B]|uniref:hypothetical protein n=1 Tax=Corallococcus sp. CA054B TaxID=2316734 RepID=UPI001F1B1AA7
MQTSGFVGAVCCGVISLPQRSQQDFGRPTIINTSDLRIEKQEHGTAAEVAGEFPFSSKRYRDRIELRRRALRREEHAMPQ